MKKIISVLFLTLLIVGCQSQSNKQTYEAVLAGPIDIKSNEVISIPLLDVKPLTKSEDNIQTDKSGLVLNAKPEVINDVDYAHSLSKGAKFIFKLEAPVIATKSIPSQIAGDSIINVEFSK